MGRTVGQQWYGGTEGAPRDSLQSPPPPGLRGLGRTVGQQWYGGTEGAPRDSLQSPPPPGLRGWEGLWESSGMVGLRDSPPPPRLPSTPTPTRTQGMGRTVGQQWYGGTEGAPRDSLQSPPPPGLMGWEGLWDSSGMVGLRGPPEAPFNPHPRQDSWDGKDCGTAVVWWD